MKRPAIAARILTALCLALIMLGAVQFTSEAFSRRAVASAERPAQSVRVSRGAVAPASFLFPPANGVSYETVHQIPSVPCSPTPRFAGFEYDLQNRPVLGWSESSSCGGGTAYRWSRFETGAWAQNTITQAGCCGGIRGEADLALSPAGTPFFAYSVPDAFIFGGTWHTAHIVDLGVSPTGHGSSVQPIGSFQDCVAAFPKFAMDFAPGATAPSLVIGTHCSFSGWLALNSASVHGDVPFRTPAGTGGEFQSVDYATSPNGSHHLTYYSERGGPNWGAYYSNGSPGHEVLLAQPHRNRRAETSVAVGPDGRIHVAIGGVPLCGNTFEGGLLYLTSMDGVNWTRSFVDHASGRNPSIVLDPTGQPHIAYWRYSNEVRFASLDAGAWNTTPVYTTTNPVSVTSVKLAYDNSGQPHVLFFDPDTGNITISSGVHSNLAPAATSPGDQTSAAGDIETLQILASDAETDALSYSACNLPPGLTIDPGTGLITGTVTPGTPPSTYHVTISVTDIVGNTSTVGFSWTIAVNNAPLLTNPGDLTNAEGDAVSVDVAASDPDNDVLTFTATNLPPGLTIDPVSGVISGGLSYSAAGLYTVTIAASDGSLSDSETFDWTVTNVNRLPTASSNSVSTPEDTSIEIALAAFDNDGDPLTYSIVGSSSNGGITLLNNVVTYLPNENFNGPDSFTFKANDGAGDSNTASVSLTVTPVNDAPNAQPDLASTSEDVPVKIVVLTNDTDVDGDTLTLTTVSQGANGSVSTNPDGSVTYTPNLNYFGSDTFTYTVEDSEGIPSTSSVAITINPVNDAPTAFDGSAAVNEDAQVEITLVGADIDSSGLDFATIEGTLNGTLSTVVGNKVVYTPNPNFSGTDAFTFKAKDGGLDSNIACVTINVLPVADAPILATVGDLTIAEGALLTVQLSAFDPDGDVLVFTASGLPDGATLAPASGAFAWTPTFDQAGTYTVVFTVADPGGLAHTQTSMITVTDVGNNNGPVCSAAYPSINEIWPPNHKRTDVVGIFGLSDPDNDPLSVRVLQILQDEPTNTFGDGTTWIDGGGVGTPNAWVRAERSGTNKVPGNGRVYEIFFEASDGRGKTCTGSVKVGVPHDQAKGPAIDDGKRYDSTITGGPCLNCSN